MPLTKLDTNAALIVIDLQKGIVVIPTVHPAGEIIGRAAQLARAFRERSLPVVLVNVTGRAPGSLLRNWTSTPTITRLASNDGARSSAHHCMITCVSEA